MVMKTSIRRLFLHGTSKRAYSQLCLSYSVESRHLSQGFQLASPKLCFTEVRKFCTRTVFQRPLTPVQRHGPLHAFEKKLPCSLLASESLVEEKKTNVRRPDVGALKITGARHPARRVKDGNGEVLSKGHEGTPEEVIRIENWEGRKLAGTRTKESECASSIVESQPNQVFDEPVAETLEGKVVYIDLSTREEMAPEESQGNLLQLRKLDLANLVEEEKPMCFYFTQGLCTMEHDPSHQARFSHTFLPLLPPSNAVILAREGMSKSRPGPFDVLLVLDLEGREEILEVAIVLLDVKSLLPLDRFHRFVRPCKMGKQRQAEYIKGKYGPFRMDKVWHDTAVSFPQVLTALNDWLLSHGLLSGKGCAEQALARAAFVTCGNWDIKTKIPEQCVDLGVHLPSYLNEWANVKDLYLNHYKRYASGMRSMMRDLGIPQSGSHHLGWDDVHNITKVVQRLLVDGAMIQITARRHGLSPKDVRYTFNKRVR
eukprot:TRINITY_DN8748_c0_g2_i1.p1 TRINITY_DN8748_c0_g2~~TRINITY_DN8748_c0_g2_i1.p1  ORF type:complete len:484 (+),score=35.31 TRINITY_DN8748_c0_g2_i1:1376-2827(+)